MKNLHQFTPMYTTWWVKRSPRRNFQAFTLAEVLITLGIIGVVAAMTIPTLVADYQKRTYDTAATTFERKLGEALKVMNSQSALAGYATTEDFVQELSKHFKITKTCANDKLTECFGEEVFWGSGTATPEAVDMSKIKKAKHFGQKEWQETNIVGVQFASGVTALIAYNKDATQDPYSNQIVSISGGSNGKSGSVSLSTNSLAILYDTNGAKSPNQSSKDLRSINVSKLAGSNCFADVNGVCITMPIQQPTPLSKAECEAIKSTHGIKECKYRNDYWAGAVKLCGGTDKMASSEDLINIATYVYETDVKGYSTSNLNINTTKAGELGIPLTDTYLWDRREGSVSNTGDILGGIRKFCTSTNCTSSTGTLNRDRTALAVCVD